MTPEEEEWFQHPGRYRIAMEGRWDLEDLFQVPHLFEQCYSFIYCFDELARPISAERIAMALRAYPWRGGYSYVNVYAVLRNQVEWRDRPRVRAVQYASPGWLDLALNPSVAFGVAKSVLSLAIAGAGAVKGYAAAHKAIVNIKVERKRANIEFLKLTSEERKLLLERSESEGKLMSFNGVGPLNEQTGNPVVTLKLLLAHHRRIKALGKYVEDGKIVLPAQNGTDDEEGAKK